MKLKASLITGIFFYFAYYVASKAGTSSDSIFIVLTLFAIIGIYGSHDETEINKLKEELEASVARQNRKEKEAEVKIHTLKGELAYRNSLLASRNMYLDKLDEIKELKANIHNINLSHEKIVNDLNTELSSVFAMLGKEREKNEQKQNI